MIAEGSISYHHTNGIWSAGSEHTGGAQFAMADGSVRFISESIDSGNLAVVAPAATGGSISPYGVWGALGTKSLANRSLYPINPHHRRTAFQGRPTYLTNAFRRTACLGRSQFFMTAEEGRPRVDFIQIGNVCVKELDITL